MIHQELKDRSIIRTANNPTGDYAELLFSRAFDWELQTSSALYDAIDRNGIRYQIKCRRGGGTQLSTIRNIETKPFDVLAAVALSQDYSVARAALIPHQTVVEKARYSTHVKGWNLLLKSSIWDLSGVEDVTEQLKTAEQLFA